MLSRIPLFLDLFNKRACIKTPTRSGLYSRQLCLQVR
uniref:Uncharacterized protein n=1 Tax=Anguilla anguilla TaxID=7936 RepID=A0A0E9W697_ANGAN